MERKDFLKYSTFSAGALLTGGVGSGMAFASPRKKKLKPLAITMWDFSWLERRWPGAGYEDWDQALDELTERGYNAVRIDAYPHLLAANPTKEWTLLPAWDQQDWGSPGVVKVKVMPALIQFMQQCKKRNIKVGLSTWFREDPENLRMKVTTPEILAAIWIKTLDLLAAENLLDIILYVDLCNEWTSVWSPFFTDKDHNWATPASLIWLNGAIQLVKEKYPHLPYTFSFDYTGDDVGDKLRNTSLPYFDLIEQHVWMASLNKGEFNHTVGYNWHKFSSESYKNLIEKGEPLYRSKPEYWQKLLTVKIKEFAAAAHDINLPLITTECWSIVDYKDYPMLNWDWVKETCALGVETAAATGQWVAMATSNFCGPQFVGMWRDVEWHQRLTSIIKNAPISEGLSNRKILDRL